MDGTADGIGLYRPYRATFIIIPDLYLAIFAEEAGRLDATALRDAVRYLLIILAVWGWPDAHH